MAKLAGGATINQKATDMSPLGKVILINLGVLLAYMVVIFSVSMALGRNDAGITFGLIGLVASAIHALVALILAIINFSRQNTTQGAGFIISFAVVLLIGVSACFGGLAMSSGMNFH